MVNSEFINYDLKKIFQKYSGKNNHEVIFKMSKMVFYENDEVQEFISLGVGKQPILNFI